MALSIMTFSLMTLSILTLYYYAKYHIIFGMPRVIMPDVAMLSVMAPLCTLVLKF
jgi:hypothetical protein